MADLLAHKFVGSLPSTLDANALYFVRVGAGFDVYVTNASGTVIAYSLNVAPGTIVSATEPTDQREGMLWYHPTEKITRVRSNGAWTPVIANTVAGDGIVNIRRLTQAQYDALNPKSNTTLYVIAD